jgi:hypothetical protein
MTLKEKYKKQISRSPFIFDKKGKIRGNFSYTDSYVSWLENQINSNKQIANDFAIGFAKFYYVEKIGETKDSYKSTEEILEIYKEL